MLSTPLLATGAPFSADTARKYAGASAFSPSTTAVWSRLAVVSTGVRAPSCCVGPYST